jgi:hypothetical protein
MNASRVSRWMGLAGAVGLALSVAVLAQTPPATQPSTRPAALPADQLLSQMLRPNEAAARPLNPQPSGDVRDATSGSGATSPNAPAVPLLREGTFIVDRTGRLASRSGDAGVPEFIFDADGRALRDPPLLILPNLKLQTMEDAGKSQNRDLRFRITGVVTEYRGRNAILVEKVVVIPE